jgi:hypothetical protein
VLMRGARSAAGGSRKPPVVSVSAPLAVQLRSPSRCITAAAPHKDGDPLLLPPPPIPRL